MPITKKRSSIFATLVTAMAMAITLPSHGFGKSNPIDKAFDSVGGKQALLELRGFSFDESGKRFDPGQGLLPGGDPITVSTFRVRVLHDVKNDRLSWDWKRKVFYPLKSNLVYRDVVAGNAGYQIGNDFTFNPPKAVTDRPLGAQHIGALRQDFRLLNPQLYLRAVATGQSTATIKADVKLDGNTHHVIEISDGVRPVTLFFNATNGRLSMLRILQNNINFGDVVTEIRYRDWAAASGGDLMFPAHVELSNGGDVRLSATRTNAVVNPEFSPTAFTIPTSPKTKTDKNAAKRAAVSSPYHTRWYAMGLPFDGAQTRVVATAVAGDPNIQYLTGGSHNSLAVKSGREIVVVEPPLDETRSKAVLSTLNRLWPDAKVRHVIITHHHFDHMGGIRTYAAAGATIVTSELNSDYIVKALGSSHTLVSDDLERVTQPKWRIEKVARNREYNLGAGQYRIKIRHIATSHSADMLVAYVPSARVIFESDVYVPGSRPPHQPLPAPFSVWAGELRADLATFDWDINWIAAGHAFGERVDNEVAPFADLQSHFEK